MAGDYRVTAGGSPGEDERNGYHHDDEEYALQALVTFPNIDLTTAIPSAGRGQQVSAYDASESCLLAEGPESVPIPVEKHSTPTHRAGGLNPG